MATSRGIKKVPEEEPKVGGLVAAVAGILLFGFIGNAALVPKNKTAPPGAQVFADDGFALAPPPGWSAVAPPQGVAVTDVLFGRKVGGMPVPGGEYAPLVTFVESGAPNDAKKVSPLLSVTVVDSQPPTFDERSREEGTRTWSEAVAEVMPGYKVASSRIDTLDGLPALRIDGTARLVDTKIELPMPPVDPLAQPTKPKKPEETPVTVAEMVVPGRGRGYLLMAASPDADLADSQPALDAAVASFAVTERPYRLGAVLRAVLMVGLLVGLGYCVATLLRVGARFARQR